jgi:hypothetical protein
MLPNNICHLVCQDGEWAREKDVDLVPEHPDHSFKYYLGKHLKSRNNCVLHVFSCLLHLQSSHMLPISWLVLYAAEGPAVGALHPEPQGLPSAPRA